MAITKVSSGLISADASSIDLNIDAGTLYLDVSENRVGIGTSSPDEILHVNAADSGNSLVAFTNSTTGLTTEFVVGINASEQAIIYNENNTDMIFATNDTERLRIDNSGNVGIGTDSPDTLLNIASSSAPTLRIENTDSTLGLGQVIGAVEFYKTDTSGAGAGVAGGMQLLSTFSTGSRTSLAFSTSNADGNNVEHLRVDDSGNVGIGTDNPSAKLHVEGATSGANLLIDDSTGYGVYVSAQNSFNFNYGNNATSTGYINFRGYQDGATQFRNTNIGNGKQGTVAFFDGVNSRLGIGTTSPDGKLDIEGNFETSKALVLTNTQGTGKVSYLRSHGGNGETLALYHDGSRRQIWDSSGFITFENGGTERMRIDSSGNVLVGATSAILSASNRGNVTINGASDSILNLGIGGNQAGYLYHNGTALNLINTKNGELKFFTNDTERMRINSSGNVKIKTTNDYYANDLVLSCANNGGITVVGGTGDLQYLAFADGTSGNARYRGYIEYSHSSDQMAFATGGETKARINSANDWHFGENSSDFRLRGGNYGSIFDSNPNQNHNIRYHNTAGMYFNVGRSTGNYVFEQNGTGRFTISSSGGANGSDRKLKTNIEDIEYGLETVKLLQPRKFDWKDTPEEEKESIGFIAQEVQEIIPELVTSSEHPDGEENNTLFLNYAAMTSVLTKAIQEQQTIIDDLKSRIETLEG